MFEKRIKIAKASEKKLKKKEKILDKGNCQNKINTSVEFTMLNLNIAENIPDQGNTS